ncbi:hypothetical protein PFISCL1PPCAC_1739, partial [Pristionchus fissidentatus]
MNTRDDDDDLLVVLANINIEALDNVKLEQKKGEENTVKREVKEEEEEDGEMREEEELEKDEDEDVNMEEDNDIMEDEERESEGDNHIPHTFLKYRNPQDEVEDDEIIVVYDTNEERKREKREKEKERMREELKKKEKILKEELKKKGKVKRSNEELKKSRGKTEKYDNGRRRGDSHSDRYEKRHASDRDHRHSGRHSYHRHHDDHYRSRREKNREKKKKRQETHSKRYSRYNDTTRHLSHSDSMEAFSSDYISEIAHNSSAIQGEENFVITSLNKGHKELELKKVKTTRFSLAMHPLGTAYDRVLRMWIYTNTGQGTVEIATYEGYVKDSIEGFDQPSAIAILKHGSQFAVIDNNGIYVIDLSTNTRKVVADCLRGTCRGLAITEDGNLATIMHKTPSFIYVYKASDKNNILCSIRLYSDENAKGNSSFICSCKELIYTSDLNLNILSCFSYNKQSKNLCKVWKRDLSNSKNRTCSIRTKYMSGIVSDSNHNLLVADARSGKIHLLTPTGSFIQTIRFEQGSRPYIAGLALSPTGRIMVVHR